MTRPTPLLLILAGLLTVPLTNAYSQQSSLVYRQQGSVTADFPLIPGDAIRLSFWREPDLGGEFPVDETGGVVLPLLGQRVVTGVRLTELKRQLLQEYAEQLRNQEVQITLLRRVRVLGAVNEPGLYYVDQTMTLGDAVALAGGATIDGKMKDIMILRDGEEIRSELDSGTRVAEEVLSGDQIMVPRRSWFSRYGAVIVASTITATTIILVAAMR